MKKTAINYITLKLFKARNKENNLKIIIKNKACIYRGTKIRMTTYFLSEIMQAKR